MPYGDIVGNMNKARLAEAGRGIIPIGHIGARRFCGMRTMDWPIRKKI